MDRKQLAYSVEAWFNGEPAAGPQCSSNGEYCFLCDHSEQPGDPVGDLKAVVRKMVGQRKELPTIVNAVSAIYDEHIRSEVIAKGPTGAELVAPSWSKRSISCHLIYSTEFPELFEAVVTQMHQSVIMALNRELISANGIIPEACDELRKMTASLKKWQTKPK